MGMESVFKLSLVLDMMDNMSDKLSLAQQNATTALGNLNAGFGMVQKTGAAMAGVGGSILGVSAKMVTATFDTQDALGELKSLGVENLKAVEDAARNFSNTWAGTTKSEFITASYDIKSGIASLSDEGVAEYTELAGLTAKATKSTTGEMTSLFATGYGIYKGFYDDLSDMEFGEMFSSGISTAVKNYKTSGSEMAASISTLGASATNANVPMEEQLAILGQLQATMSGSEAGTKYKAFLNAAASAGEKLGLTFMDSNNQLLSMPEILTALKGKYGDTIDAVEKQQLKEAFGTDEAIALIDLLYNDIDGLSSGIGDLQESMQGGAAATQEMAAAINDTPAQKFEVIKQQIHNNTEALASGLLPSVNKLLDGVSNVISAGSDWIANNQGTVDSIMQIAVKIGIVLVVVGVLAAVFGTLGKTVSGAIGTVGSMAKAMSKLNGVFLANPIIFVIVAVIALIAVFNQLYSSSESFRNLWNNISALLPQVVQLGFQVVMNLIQSLISALPQIISTGTQIIISLIQGLASALPMIISSAAMLIGMLVAGVITNLPNIIMSGIQIIFALVNGLISAIPSLIAAIPTLFGQIIDAILSVNWLQVGFDIIASIIEGLLGALGSLASALIDGIKGILDGGETESSGAEAAESMASGIESNAGVVKEAASTTGNAALEGFSDLNSMFAGASGMELSDMFGNGILNGESGVQNAAETTGGAALNGFGNLNGVFAGESGAELSNMFGNGILSGSGQAENAAALTGNAALSGFNVDATQQGAGAAETFGNGMAASSEAATTAASTVTGAWTQADSELASIWGGLPDKFKNAWSQVDSAAKSAASSTVEAVKSAFSNMSISIPRPSLPKVNVSYSTVGSGDATAKVPNFSVSYFAKGGIMKKPTAFGREPNGNVMVGGEAGAEAIVPLTELWDKMRFIIGSFLGKEKEEKTDIKSIMKRETFTFSKKGKEETDKRGTLRKRAGTIIQTLKIEVDISKIDELEKLYKLIDELEDAQNGTDDDDVVFA